MAGVIDSFSFILKKSFDLTLWFYLFLILILSVVGAVIIFFAGIFIGVILFLVFQLSLIGLFFYFLLFLVFLVVFLLFGSAITGTSLNFVRDYLQTGQKDLGSAFNKAKPRIFTSFKVELIVSLFFLLVLIVFFLPFIFSLIQLINSISLQLLIAPNSAEMLSLIVSLLGSFLLGIGLFLIFSLVISPFSVIYKQIPFFESKGAVDSIKRAIFLAKKNYWNNLAFAVLMFLFIGFITVIYLFFTFALTALTSANIGFVIIFVVLLRIIIEFVYSIWLSVFSVLFDVKIYSMNVEGEGKSKPYQMKKTFSKEPLPKMSAPPKKTNPAFKKAKPKDFLR